MQSVEEAFAPSGDPLADVHSDSQLMIAALLTARGGSLLPGKNLRQVRGVPVLAYPLKAAWQVATISDFFVSSDDEEILSIASRYGYAPIRRPDAISGANALHIDVVCHAISTMEKDYSVSPDILVVLMGNSLCTKTEWIVDCLNILIRDKEATAVIPVVEDNDHHPWRAKTIERGYLSSFVNFRGLQVSTNRQDLSPCYFIAQNFWVIRLPLSKTGEAPWTFLGSAVRPYTVPRCPDVHEEMDLVLSEQWLEDHQ